MNLGVLPCSVAAWAHIQAKQVPSMGMSSPGSLWPTEGLTRGQGLCLPLVAPRDCPQSTEEQAQGSTGLQGLFYSLLWSIQKQLTEIIKSSIPDPHSSSCPSLSSWSAKPSSDLKLLLKNALDKGGGDRNTPLTKEKGNGLKCATKISTRTQFLMLESLLYGDWQDRDTKSAPSG